MLYLRSALFQIVFYLNFLVYGVTSVTFALLLPRKIAWAISVSWFATSRWIWEKTTGGTFELRGLENLPEGGCIIAAKHQSAWETLFLIPEIYKIAFVMKRELMWLPIFGWFAAKTRQIPINRGKGSKVIKPMTEAARAAVAEGRKVVIFPQGTRVPVGEERPYKIGVARLYNDLQCPIVPVALNTGLFWPKNSLLRYPGKVIIEYLPPIMPGKDTETVMAELESIIEERSIALIHETAASPNPPATIEKALRKIESANPENA